MSDVRSRGSCSPARAPRGEGGGFDLLWLSSSSGEWSVCSRATPCLAVPCGRAGALDHVLDQLGSALRERSDPNDAAGWVVALGYELGRSIEPASRVRALRADQAWPWDAVLWRCETARATSALDLGDPLFGTGEYALGAWREADREGFERAVARGVEYIHAGDVFQVNLAHKLRAPFEGSARALASEVIGEARPALGAYLELEHAGRRHAAVSLSPELFLNYDARTRRVVTRPIKGTRPISGGECAETELLSSAKDQAELAMIVDLMRNDLGRVCAYGSVRVVQARGVERLPRSGVVHTVATIEGTLRDGLDAIDLLRATFPCGSITGAPKVRAMQLIEELEPEPRGLYTGAIGRIAGDGSMTLSVAIRTAVIAGECATGGHPGAIANGELIYGVGAGVVAESRPSGEWMETLDKARVLSGVLGRGSVDGRHAACSADGAHASPAPGGRDRGGRDRA